MNKKEFNLEREIYNIKIMIALGVYMIMAIITLGLFKMGFDEFWIISFIFSCGIIVIFIVDAIKMYKWKKEDKFNNENEKPILGMGRFKDEKSESNS